MRSLVTTPNVARPDDLYQLLIDMHAGMTDEQSLRADAKLVLLLVNDIGDETIVREAIAAARGDRPEDCL